VFFPQVLCSLEVMYRHVSRVHDSSLNAGRAGAQRVISGEATMGCLPFPISSVELVSTSTHVKFKGHMCSHKGHIYVPDISSLFGRCSVLHGRVHTRG